MSLKVSEIAHSFQYIESQICTMLDIDTHALSLSKSVQVMFPLLYKQITEEPALGSPSNQSISLSIISCLYYERYMGSGSDRWGIPCCFKRTVGRIVHSLQPFFYHPFLSIKPG